MAHVMTTREVAEYLKVKPTTIVRMVKEGKIPAYKFGRDWRYDKDIIDEWLRGIK